MFHSKELFSKITSSITVEDLTFLVTKKLFEHLKTYSNEVDFFYNEDERINIAGDIYAFENIFAIHNPEHIKALWLSLLLSFFSTVICLLLAYPLAMILASFRVKNNSFIVMIFILPMWMNFLLRTLAWQSLLEKTGVINSILSFLHLPNLAIINTPYAIVLGMVYNFLPFMVLPIYNSLTKIDQNVIHAARDLGANGLKTFQKITLPLSIPGIISGITMVFVPALTTFLLTL